MGDSHEERIVALERHVGNLRVNFAGLEKEVARNTEITAAIKEDTAQMVILLKGGKIVGAFIKWTAAVGAGVYAVIRYVKGGG